MCIDIGSQHFGDWGPKTRLNTPKAVTYHKQPDYCRFVIGHSLGHVSNLE